MKKRNFLSLFFMILTVVLLISFSLSAAAVYWVCDINGDGRITAADMARLNAVVLVKPDAKPEW